MKTPEDMKTPEEKFFHKELFRWFHGKNYDFINMKNKLNTLVLPEDKGKEAIVDLVAYDSKNNEIYIVECKRGRFPTKIGHAFGQLLSAQFVIEMIGKENWIKGISNKISKMSSSGPISNSEEGIFIKKDTVIREDASLKYYVGYPDYGKIGDTLGMSEGIMKLLKKFKEYTSFGIFLIGEGDIMELNS